MRLTRNDVMYVLRQLQTIKRLNGDPVFLAWVEEDEASAYHKIMLDTGVGTHPLEFRKAHENKLEADAKRN